MEDYANESDDAVEMFMVKQEERREREGKTMETLEKDNGDLKLMIRQRAAKKDRVQELNDLIKQDPIASKATWPESAGTLMFLNALK